MPKDRQSVRRSEKLARTSMISYRVGGKQAHITLDPRHEVPRWDKARKAAAELTQRTITRAAQVRSLVLGMMDARTIATVFQVAADEQVDPEHVVRAVFQVWVDTLNENPETEVIFELERALKKREVKAYEMKTADRIPELESIKAERVRIDQLKLPGPPVAMPKEPAPGEPWPTDEGSTAEATD